MSCIGTFLEKDNFHFELWQFLLSLSVTAGSACSLLSHLLASDILSLHDFHDRTIGIVVMSATDVVSRTNLYIGIWIFAFLLFFTVFLITAYLNKKYLEELSFDFEKKLLFCLSLFSLATLFLFALSREEIFFTNYKIFLVLLVLTGTIIVIKYFASVTGKRGEFFADFLDPSFIVFSLIVPYCVIFIFWIFFDRPMAFGDGHLYIYGAIWAFFVAGYYAALRVIFLNTPPGVVKEGLIRALIPLLIIPLTIPLSNELQYSLLRWYQIAPDDIAKVLAVVLMGISILVFGLTVERQKKSDDLFHYVKNYYLPLILVSLGLFRYYRHYFVYGIHTELFHAGELLISPQQLFLFHKFPFIDIFPTHGLSEMSYQVFYLLLNGYTPLHSVLWDWIPLLIGVVVLYFFLARLTTPIFSFMFCLFLPVFSVLHYQELYLFCLIPVFSLIWFMKKPDFARFCIHWSAVMILLLWRVDFGAAALAGTVLIFAILLIRNVMDDRDRAVAFFWNMLKSFILVFGFAFLAYCLLLQLSNRDILETILVNIQMCSFQAQVQGYEVIYNMYSFEVVLEYIIFPIIALVYVALFVFDHLVRKRSTREIQISLAFLAVVTLALSIRSVQRHSLVEGFNPVLFPLLLILLPLNFEIRKKQVQHAVIVGLFLLYIIAVPAFPIVFPAESSRFFEYHAWSANESRIIEDKGSYQNLTYLLKNTLNKDETFYDFSNAPLLYIFTDKEFLPYLIPNIYQSSEINQNATIERLDFAYRQGRVPLLLFRQGNGWDSVDGVPNEIRSYRIAEYIYSHYRPLGYIDGRYQIWIADNADMTQRIRFGTQPGFSMNTTLSQDFDLRKLPYIWGTYDTGNAVSATRILENLSGIPVSLEKDREYPLSVDPDIDKSSGNYLCLDIRSVQPALVSITYGETYQGNFTFVTEPTGEYENYCIRVSTQWNWMNSTVDRISINSSEAIELRGMTIRKGD